MTNVPYKQIVVAAGEGAKAALSASDYLLQPRSDGGSLPGREGGAVALLNEQVAADTGRFAASARPGAHDRLHRRRVPALRPGRRARRRRSPRSRRCCSCRPGTSPPTPRRPPASASPAFRPWCWRATTRTAPRSGITGCPGPRVRRLPAGAHRPLDRARERRCRAAAVAPIRGRRTEGLRPRLLPALPGDGLSVRQHRGREPAGLRRDHRRRGVPGAGRPVQGRGWSPRWSSTRRSRCWTSSPPTR